MNNVKVVLNIAGLREFRNSSEVTALIQEHTERIAKEAGDSKPAIEHGKTRVKGLVKQNMTSEDMENNTLLKAVHK